MMPAFDTLHGIGDKAGVKTAHLQLLSKYTKALVGRAFSTVIRAGRHRYARRTVVYMIQNRILPCHSSDSHSLTRVLRSCSARLSALSEWQTRIVPGNRAQNWEAPCQARQRGNSAM
jgi:hypothetical protein